MEWDLELELELELDFGWRWSWAGCGAGAENCGSMNSTSDGGLAVDVQHLAWE